MDIPSSLPTARPAPLPEGTVVAAWLGSTSALLTIAVLLLAYIG
jgi:hypothetical protein